MIETASDDIMPRQIIMIDTASDDITRGKSSDLDVGEHPLWSLTFAALEASIAVLDSDSALAAAAAALAAAQGLTLIHLSAQLKRNLSDGSACRDCLGGVEEVSEVIKEYQGVFSGYFVSETAQVEMRSGRV